MNRVAGATTREYCSQCGKMVWESACGPTHALLYWEYREEGWVNVKERLPPLTEQNYIIALNGFVSVGLFAEDTSTGRLKWIWQLSYFKEEVQPHHWRNFPCYPKPEE